MVCPICEKRKAVRSCPAKGEDICSVCCGTEREVTIDCPFHCPYLAASRAYDHERKTLDWSKMPYPDVELSNEFVANHSELVDALAYTICLYAKDHPPLVDSDVLASVLALTEAYRTLTSGIHYEKLPDYALQRGLYTDLKKALEDYQVAEARESALGRLRPAEVRDVLIYLTHVGYTRTNGRPKGRAFIDFLRAPFGPEALPQSGGNLIVLP